MILLGNKVDLVPFIVSSMVNANGKRQHSITKSIDVIPLSVPLNSVKATRINLGPNQLNALQQWLMKAPGIKAGNLRYMDTFFPRELCNGVYLFYKGETLEYVGKCSSMTFVERIGGHLASRNGDFKNIVLKLVSRHYFNSDLESGLDDVMNYVCEMTIKYIPVWEPKMKTMPVDGSCKIVSNKDIGILEKSLNSVLHPTLNPIKQK